MSGVARKRKSLQVEDVRGDLAFAEMFWSRVDSSGDGCWEWQGSRMDSKSHAYGQVGYRGAVYLAHRVAFALANAGDMPPEVDHVCSNPPCVRPAHLRGATRKQNSENRASANSNSQSGVRGVIWAPWANRWRGTLVNQGRRIHVGYFRSVEEASAAVAERRRQEFTHSIERGEAA